MSDPSRNDPDDLRQRLSELVDGEADAAQALRLSAEWRDRREVRETWHAYQLIGDVLRSEDLARGASHDAAFLQSLRVRLAAEPVVLAPAPKPLPLPSSRRRWTTSAAVAAGFVAVAGSVVVMRGVQSPPEEPVLARSPVVAVPVAATEPAADVQALVADGQLIRDARLERYLAAHKRYSATSAVALPGGVLRSAATFSPER